MSRPRKLAHVTTTDMSLRFLLLPQFEAMRAAGYEIYGLSAPGPFRAELERAGVHLIDIPHLSRGKHGVGDVRALWELFRAMSREKFDVVHTHIPKAGFLGRVAAKLAGVPRVIHTIHGLPFTDESPRWLVGVVWLMETVGALLCDKVLLQNEDDLKTVLRMHMARERQVELLGNGIDVQRFHPTAISAERVAKARADIGVGPNDVVVGIVARLVWNKGYAEFFEAAKAIRARHKHVHFVVAGPLEPAKAERVPEETVRALEADGTIHYLGLRTDIETVYAMFDIATLPSFFPEGVPRALMEPAAMGKPLIAADSRGCRDVVVDGVNGLLVPPHDGPAFAAAIERLVLDPALRATMGVASRERVLAHFDERRVAERCLHWYGDTSTPSPTTRLRQDAQEFEHAE